VRAKARKAPARTGRAKERGARVAAGHRQNRRHHAVLDERTRDDQRHLRPDARLAQVGVVVDDRCSIRGILARRLVTPHFIDRRRPVEVHGRRRVERLAERNVHVHVALLVVDHDVLFLGCGGRGG